MESNGSFGRSQNKSKRNFKSSVVSKKSNKESRIDNNITKSNNINDD